MGKIKEPSKSFEGYFGRVGRWLVRMDASFLLVPRPKVANII